MEIAVIDPSGFTPPYDHSLATALAGQGCKVVLVTGRLPPGLWSTTETYERWEHFYSLAGRFAGTRVRTYAKGCEHPFDMARLLVRLKRWRPDIIHFQWLPFPAVDRFFLLRFRRIAPLVLTVHDTEPFHGAPSTRFQLAGLSSAFRCFDHYIVHTQHSKDALTRQLGLAGHRVTVIPHGVFTYYRELVSSTRPSEQAGQLVGKKKILFFGTLKPYKGVDVLLEAFARLPAPLVQDAVLQIVGQPRMPIEPLQALARRLRIEDHIFWDLRFVDEKEVAAYFYQADVVVLPYRRIDQSGVLMVALAFGKPIVASRVGGFPETVQDGVNGFLVEPGNPETLSRALARLLEDEELRSRMTKASEEMASGPLAWQAVAAKTVEVYRRLLQNNWRGRGDGR